MSNWFTADLHLGHANIIKYCNRPFTSASEMDMTLIQRWNSVVKPEDTVYFLGDFCFAVTEQAKAYLSQLHGQIHFIEGNHDKSAFQIKHMFSSYRKFSEINIENTPITLCHYAMRVFNKSHRGAYHLYGHSHGTLPEDDTTLSFDCGVDTNNFYPYSWEDVKRRMSAKLWKPIDHHGNK